MPAKRLQNKIGESRFSLPVTAVYAVLVCLLSGMFGINHGWVTAIVWGLSTLLMVELNNAYALIRTSGQMIACCYLGLTLAAGISSFSLWPAIIEFLLIGFYLLLFRSYQDKRAAGTVFYAFTLFGVAILLHPPLLLPLPVIWFMMRAKLMSMSWKTFFASLLGLFFPLWILVGIAFYTDYWLWLPSFHTILNYIFTPLNPFVLPVPVLVTAGWVILLSGIGSIHFLRNSFRDKIRTRMLFEWFITLAVFATVMLFVNPVEHEVTLSLLIINTAPLIGHYITLTHTRFTNWSVVFIMAVTVGLTLFNLFSWNF